MLFHSTGERPYDKGNVQKPIAGHKPKYRQILVRSIITNSVRDDVNKTCVGTESSE